MLSEHSLQVISHESPVEARRTRLPADSMEFVYQTTVLAYQLQWDRLGRLDSKINNTVVASTAAATLFLGLGGPMLQAIPKSDPLHIYLVILMIGGLVFFTLCLALSIVAYKLREYRYDPNPIKLVQKYSKSEKEATLETLSHHISSSADHNKLVNDSKTQILSWAMFALLAGVLALLAFSVTWAAATIN